MFSQPNRILAAIFAVSWMLYCLWLWQPERQVRKHHEHFIKAAENRNWSRVEDFIDARYADRWGHDKAFVLRESREVLRQFFALSIESDVGQCDVSGETGTVVAKLKIAGTGTVVAEYAKQAVNGLGEPFAFQWTRRSWKPWDWKLTRVDNSQLRINRGAEF
jgi:hypothetical protein